MPLSFREDWRRGPPDRETRAPADGIGAGPLRLAAPPSPDEREGVGFILFGGFRGPFRDLRCSGGTALCFSAFPADYAPFLKARTERPVKPSFHAGRF